LTVFSAWQNTATSETANSLYGEDNYAVNSNKQSVVSKSDRFINRKDHTKG